MRDIPQRLNYFHYHSGMKKHGFLSPNLPALIANIRKNGACQFAVAEAFNELGMCALRDIHIDPANRQEVLGDSLFGRVLTSFQSAVILCERGLLSDAATLIRSAAETAGDRRYRTLGSVAPSSVVAVHSNRLAADASCR